MYMLKKTALSHPPESGEGSSGVQKRPAAIDRRDARISAASVPHFPLTPRGVKADGAHLLRPLHGVDGQLPRGGGGADGGGIVHRVENRSGGKQCRAAHHVPPPQQKYPYLLHIEFAPFCHNLCGGGVEKKRRDRTPEKPLFAGLAPQNPVQCSGQQEPRLRQCEKTFPGGRSTVIDFHFQKTRT